jgi:hypothetical protein
MGGACSTYGGHKNCVQHFGETTSREKSFGKTWHKWENIKMDFLEIACEDVGSIKLTQD